MGSPRGVRMPKLAKSAISYGQPRLAFMATSSSQALIQGRDIPFGPVHRGLASCHAGCLLFPAGMVARQGTKQQEKLGTVQAG